MLNRGHADQVSIVERSADKYIWQPKPINIWVAMSPYNALQAHVLQELRWRLEAQGCLFVESPHEATELGPVAHLAIGFGQTLEEESSPFVVYGRLPKPRGTVLMITVAERIPDGDLFDLARGHLVKKSGHLGIILEGDPDDATPRRALWGSMAGNNRLLEGAGPDILDNLALRVLAHAGAEKVNRFEGADPNYLTWDAWIASPLHRDIAEAAQALGAADIIENEVPLHQYATGDQVRTVLRFLERAALGEGMRSQIDPALRVMGVTTTGGDKINVSPDPLAGQVVPIRRLTRDGYLEATPQGCPIQYNAPSIETHENGLVYLAGALINAGLVDTLDSFLEFLDDHFATHETIDILPEGLQPKALAMDHFHRQPKRGSVRHPARVEIVYPAKDRFPEIDFPCGVREGGLQLLSAVFESNTFTQPGPLDKLVLVILPGHGSVALYHGPRRELTDLLVNGMEMEEVTRV